MSSAAINTNELSTIVSTIYAEHLKPVMEANDITREKMVELFVTAVMGGGEEETDVDVEVEVDVELEEESYLDEEETSEEVVVAPEPVVEYVDEEEDEEVEEMVVAPEPVKEEEEEDEEEVVEKKEEEKEKKTKKEKKEKKAKAPKYVKPDYLLPFDGTVDENRCYAVKANKGLNTQCFNKPKKGEEYCSACFKQAQANETGRPNYGDIREHAKCEPHTAYVNDKGKKTIPYVDVVEKLQEGLTLDVAREYAKSLGMDILDVDTVTAKKRRTKKKTAVVSEE